MSHYTNVGGSAYEITGGKVNVDGTAYEVVKGKTLVDGTAYDILFSLTITIKHSSRHSAGRIVIDDVTYYDEADGTTQVLRVPYGTSMYARCGINTHGDYGVYYNGEDMGISTTITIVRDTIVEFESYMEEDYSAANNYYSYVDITD